MILVVNVGSASIKYGIYNEGKESANEEERGFVEDFPSLLGKVGKRSPSVIGHRVVHGGPKYFSPTKISPSVLEDLNKFSVLAPLHNPPSLEVIKLCQSQWKEVPNYAVFDTGFFKDLPIFAQVYPLPFEYFKDKGIRRYGFHGLAYEDAVAEAAKRLGKRCEELRLIVCHLGGGASVAAISGGKPLDISMGFTPLEGLMMSTRAGDLDPGIIFYLQKELGMTLEEVEEVLNKKSGLLGISGISADPRDIVEATKETDQVTERTVRAGLALQIYAYRLKKYIGAYLAVLGGADAIVFAGPLGANVPLIREMATHGLENLFKLRILFFDVNEERVLAEKVFEAARR